MRVEANVILCDDFPKTQIEIRTASASERVVFFFSESDINRASVLAKSLVEEMELIYLTSPCRHTLTFSFLKKNRKNIATLVFFLRGEVLSHLFR